MVEIIINYQLYMTTMYYKKKLYLRYVLLSFYETEKWRPSGQTDRPHIYGGRQLDWYPKINLSMRLHLRIRKL